jgi:two-component system chemotaxis response regulator CheB
MIYEAVVIGVSAGGINALKIIFTNISKNFKLPVIVVQHLHPHSDSFLAEYLNSLSLLHIKEAEDKEQICPGTVYIAPANYHLLVEEDRTLSLNTDERINYSRPSIDVLFNSAADVYGSKLIGIILTGANDDGVTGMKKIKKYGGLTIVQDPKSAEVDFMPLSVLEKVPVDHVLALEKIAFLLGDIGNNNLQLKN